MCNRSYYVLSLSVYYYDDSMEYRIVIIFIVYPSPSVSIILTILFLYFCHLLRKYCSGKIEEHLNRDRVRNYKLKQN